MSASKKIKLDEKEISKEELKKQKEELPKSKKIKEIKEGEFKTLKKIKG